jgi:hypothetical protein
MAKKGSRKRRMRRVRKAPARRKQTDVQLPFDAGPYQEAQRGEAVECGGETGTAADGCATTGDDMKYSAVIDKYGTKYTVGRTMVNVPSNEYSQTIEAVALRVANTKFQPALPVEDNRTGWWIRLRRWWGASL